jgi:hypothetical protein
LVLSSLLLTAAMLSVGPETLRLRGKAHRGTGTLMMIMLATFPVEPLAKVANGLPHGLGRVRPVFMSRGALAAAVVGGSSWLGVAGGGAAGIVGLTLAAPVFRLPPPDEAAWLETFAGARWRRILAGILRACAPAVEKPLGGHA